jgi:hypothetical protein
MVRDCLSVCKQGFEKVVAVNTAALGIELHGQDDTVGVEIGNTTLGTGYLYIFMMQMAVTATSFEGPQKPKHMLGQADEFLGQHAC